MKIKILKIEVGTKLLYKKKEVKVGEVIDLPKERAEHYIKKGIAEAVKDEPTKTKKSEKWVKGV